MALVGFVSLGLTSCVPPKNYVALGDSYSSGPLIPVQQTSPAGCMRSDHNYPHLVSPGLNVPQFRDVSCSGAETKDMTTSQAVTPSPNPPPQFDALDANTAAVSLTIGGNDIGFTNILADCFSGPCKAHYVSNGHDDISDRIAALNPKVATLLQGIHSRAPGAKIFLLGYLDILPLSGVISPACFGQLPIQAADAPYLRDKEAELNAMLRTVSGANGATYVDTYPPTGSPARDACQAPTVRWVEPLAAVNAYPVHPNAQGMQADAADLSAVMHRNGF
ncbi:MAG: SGNH/GDSL hydrolase family protein [Actinomycetota bacterium]|nr:SGNH/GDSL hydrolase family protein [Actinomycetota bacterium]